MSYKVVQRCTDWKVCFQDGTSVDIHGHLKTFNKEALSELKPLWHCDCYSDVIYNKQGSMYTGSYAMKKMWT